MALQGKKHGHAGVERLCIERQEAVRAAELRSLRPEELRKQAEARLESARLALESAAASLLDAVPSTRAYGRDGVFSTREMRQLAATLDRLTGYLPTQRVQRQEPQRWAPYRRSLELFHQVLMAGQARRISAPSWWDSSARSWHWSSSQG